MVSVNEQGQRVGESHPRARLTNTEIDQMFDMHRRGSTIAGIARWFGRSKSHVWGILHHRKRNQLAVTWKRSHARGQRP